MSSRMDKYADTPVLKSRAEKNKDLYEKIKNSEIEKFDIHSNARVIEEDVDRIDVNKIRDMLDKQYRESIPKRILEPVYQKEDEEEKLIDTKEYDINSILEKAKQEQKVDYEKERLKKIHDTQYDILKKLNIEEEIPVMEDNEENIVNLINTITALEMKNSDKSGNTTALDLLSDLCETDTDTVYKTMELDKEKISEKAVENWDEEDLSLETKYDDFKELEMDLNSNNIAIKIVGVIFLLIVLVLLVIFINNYFNLGLF